MQKVADVQISTRPSSARGEGGAFGRRIAEHSAACGACLVLVSRCIEDRALGPSDAAGQHLTHAASE